MQHDDIFLTFMKRRFNQNVVIFLLLISKLFQKDFIVKSIIFGRLFKNYLKLHINT